MFVDTPVYLAELIINVLPISVITSLDYVSSLAILPWYVIKYVMQVPPLEVFPLLVMCVKKLPVMELFQFSSVSRKSFSLSLSLLQ